MNELTVIKSTPASIKWDKEKALKEAKNIMVKYERLEFDEEQVSIVKKEIAQLRKVSKAINAQALAEDKRLTAEVKEFRKEVNEVKAIIDNGINYMNDQVKTYEDKQKEQRKAQITFYKEWTDIQAHTQFDDSWLLKKWESKDDEKLKTLFVEMKEEIDRGNKIIKQTATTNGLKPDLYIEKFKTMALDEVVDLIIDTAANNDKVEQPQPVKVDTTEQVLSITRTLKGTRTQLKALKEYAETLGIEWIK